jgi:hypothetical protein
VVSKPLLLFLSLARTSIYINWRELVSFRQSPARKVSLKRGEGAPPRGGRRASMKHGEEDDTASTGGSDTTMGGGTVVKHQALRLAEDLSLPSV